MAVPKRKTTPSRRNMRRSHDKLKALNISFDKNTGEPKLGHNISLADGFYDGKQVYVTRAQKKAMKAEAAGEAESGSEAMQTQNA
ncbi:MAG: rpmF [Candidatus Midichloriaceae bacterium]|nr:rpmF [Candidatus Midichloriaceae bacterium]